MNSRIEKWAFGLTLAMFFLTGVAVLVAVGYATVHLAMETPTKAELRDEIESAKNEIIAAVRGEIRTNKDNMNSQMLNHVSDLHAKD